MFLFWNCGQLSAWLQIKIQFSDKNSNFANKKPKIDRPQMVASHLEKLEYSRLYVIERESNKNQPKKKKRHLGKLVEKMASAWILSQR